MATGYGVCIHIIPEHLAISSMGTRGAGRTKAICTERNDKSD